MVYMHIILMYIYWVISLTPLSLGPLAFRTNRRGKTGTYLKLSIPPSCINSTIFSASATFIFPSTLLTSSSFSVFSAVCSFSGNCWKISHLRCRKILTYSLALLYFHLDHEDNEARERDLPARYPSAQTLLPLYANLLVGVHREG